MAQPGNQAIRGLTLTASEVEILKDIHCFLRLPHTVQEVLSAAKTPTLALALPLYEKLVVALRCFGELVPGLLPSISVSIEKIEEYVLRSRGSRIYGLATSTYFLLSFLLFLTSFSSIASHDKAELD